MATDYVSDYEDLTGLKIPTEVEAKVITAPAAEPVKSGKAEVK